MSGEPSGDLPKSITATPRPNEAATPGAQVPKPPERIEAEKTQSQEIVTDLMAFASGLDSSRSAANVRDQILNISDKLRNQAGGEVTRAITEVLLRGSLELLTNKERVDAETGQPIEKLSPDSARGIIYGLRDRDAIERKAALELDSTYGPKPIK